MNVMIVGTSRKILYLARTFNEKGFKTTVVCNDEERGAYLSRNLEQSIVVYGDGSDPTVLEDANVDEMDIVIAMAQEDHDNIVIARLAKMAYKVHRTVIVANDPRNAEVFKQLNVDIVLSIENIISTIIEVRAVEKEINELIPVEEGRVEIMTIEIRDGYPIIGKKIRDLPFAGKASIGCIMRNSKAIMPKGDDTILNHDRLVIMALTETQSKIFSSITGKADIND